MAKKKPVKNSKKSKKSKLTSKQLQKRIDHFRSQRIFKDKLFSTFLVLSLLALLAVITVLVVSVRPKAVVVPLRYSTLQGFDALGGWYRLYIYGIFSLLVSLGNTLLAVLLYQKSRIASFFLVLGTLVVNVFTLVIILTLFAHLNI